MDNEFNEILDDKGLGENMKVEQGNDTYYKWGSILAIVSVFMSGSSLLMGEQFQILAFSVAVGSVVLVLISKEVARYKLLVIIFLVLFWSCAFIAKTFLY
jgi:hypothetical protein